MNFVQKCRSLVAGVVVSCLALAMGCRDVTTPETEGSASKAPRKYASYSSNGYCRALIRPNYNVLKVGGAQFYYIEALGCDGYTDDIYSGGYANSWTSSNPGVATVDASGLVRAVGVGTAYISVSFLGLYDRARVDVQPASVASSITVSPNPLRISSGASYQLTATVKDQYGAVLQAPVTWSTNGSSIATVSSTGLVRAVHSGVAVITASAPSPNGTISGMAEVDVDPLNVAIGGSCSTCTVRTPGKTITYTAKVSGGSGGSLTYDWFIQNAGTKNEPSFIGTGATMQLTWNCPSNGDNSLIVRVKASGGSQGSGEFNQIVDIYDPNRC